MPEPPPIWSDAFLAEEIRDQPEYKALVEDSAAFDAFVEIARKRLGEIRSLSRRAKERPTTDRVITPLLEALGWPTPVPEVRLTARDQVDLVLHATAEQGEALLNAPDEHKRVLNAAGIVECKAWGNPFDTSGSGSESRRGETAAQQIQRYLLIAGTDSNESLRWGILTNGARWRIYSYRARPRDRAWEIDLERLLVSQDLFHALDDDGIHQLRLAWLLLRRDSWIPAPGERESFLDRLLAKGRHADEQVAASLSKAIFSEVYPDLVSALWRHDEHAAADQIANAALTILYRLLFIFYAEDRGMLNTEDPRYREYSLRHGVREPAVSQLAAGNPSSVFTRFWDHLATLTEVLDHGNPEMGLPPYDGGLFATDPGSLLAQARLTDAQLAPIIKALSHTEAGDYISYRNLEIQQLGSIYERLLERVPQRDDAGQVEVVVSPYARKDSGSYYTPQELVDLIVEQTLRPLLDERIAAFEAEPTEANDPAVALLRLKILDPAMGSGHFLITAIDWLTAAIEDLLDRSDNGNDSDDDDGEPSYVSPVQAELDLIEAHRSAPLHPSIDDAIRAEIEQRRALGDQLPSPDRQSLIRRMVLKRCIYGVDKNPMAVELAKVALWLHSFAPPLPLPYLNHRIRAGDSLLGISIDAAHDYLAPWGPDHIARGLFADLAALSRSTAEAAEALDANLDLTIIAIGESFRWDGLQNQVRARLRKVLNLTAGLRWLSTSMKKVEREEFHAPLTEAISGHPGRADAILHNGENDPGLTPATPGFHLIRDQANEIADRENFFHWQVEFALVMDQGGFDAIVTNPPWERIKLQEVEWWAARREDIAKAPTAAARKQKIAKLRAAGDPLVAEYDQAAERAAQLSAVLRGSGDYPQLGKGDINLYSLFVERALSLINPDGVAGLLTPSGIYADHTTAAFFKAMSTTGRVGGIYDFENRRSANPDATSTRWFSDVHPQLKFCATIFAGSERRFAETYCGFFLDSKTDLNDADRVFTLAADDFARINPNSGNAPVLRSRIDAEIVRRIYHTHPVLVEHSAGEPIKQYPVRYRQGMFHSQNDAALFTTVADLDAAQAYHVVDNRYRRGDDEWVPLYQGRMINQFDHRANGVVRNPENVSNQFSSKSSTDEQRADPAFFTQSPYWIPASAVEARMPRSEHWSIVFRDVTNATNERMMIATVIPWLGLADTLGWLRRDDEFDATEAACLLANFNSLCLDYVAKQKVQSAHLKWFAVEQLPVIAPTDYDRQFGETTARDLICDHVLRLTYTAHDLAPFARDLGYAADPFPWDPEERRQLRARLDALYFHLYGLNEQDTAYILDQFPVLEKNERKEHNRYQTKELVLAYHRVLAAGDTTNTITLPPTPPDS